MVFLKKSNRENGENIVVTWQGSSAGRRVCFKTSLQKLRASLSVIPAKAGVHCFQVVKKAWFPFFKGLKPFCRGYLSKFPLRIHNGNYFECFCLLLSRARQQRSGLAIYIGNCGENLFLYASIPIICLNPKTRIKVFSSQ